MTREAVMKSWKPLQQKACTQHVSHLSHSFVIKNVNKGSSDSAPRAVEQPCTFYYSRGRHSYAAPGSSVVDTGGWPGFNISH